ncbi:MAG TPA: cytochrome-c peroxidase [Gemmatimonadaceae bacterium]
MHRRSWVLAAVVALGAPLIACSDQPTAPSAVSASRHGPPPDLATAALVRGLAHERGIVRLRGAPYVRPALVKLGEALAFDRILSGNRDLACTTCHLPAYETGDGRSVSIGSGGIGFGPARTHPDGTLIPRNAPPLFNLAGLRHLFWDGRVQMGRHHRVDTPAGAQITPAMQRVFEFGALSAQPMFPVLSPFEMRGHAGNELAALPDSDATAIWAGIMRRLGQIPEYRRMFEAAYPGTKFDDMTFAHASNAIAGFLVSRLTFANTPWDRFLDGDDDALTPRQLEGARTFLALKCSICHTGATLSDDQFHDVAVAQIGPGEGNGPSLRDDYGRMNVTGDPADRYRFRTSPLRNVELTGPWGHDGAYATLRGFVEHYSESDQALRSYDPMQLAPDVRGTLLDNSADILAQRDTLLDGVVLTPDVVDKLMDYMSALTDPAARDLSRLVPSRVPSGLPVDRP